MHPETCPYFATTVANTSESLLSVEVKTHAPNKGALHPRRLECSSARFKHVAIMLPRSEPAPELS